MGRTPSFEGAGWTHHSFLALPAKAAPSNTMLNVAIIEMQGVLLLRP